MGSRWSPGGSRSQLRDLLDQHLDLTRLLVQLHGLRGHHDKELLARPPLQTQHPEIIEDHPRPIGTDTPHDATQSHRQHLNGYIQRALTEASGDPKHVERLDTSAGGPAGSVHPLAAGRRGAVPSPVIAWMPFTLSPSAQIRVAANVRGHARRAMATLPLSMSW